MRRPDEKHLDQVCEALFDPAEPGAAVGVLAAGGFRYARGFGLANLAQQIPFTAKSRFRACSISKQFVCLLVRQFEQERLIDLDAHPGRYLDALSSFPPTLTVRHLCQNRSGLLDYWCVAMLTGARAESRFTLQQGEELIQSLREPMFSPGAQYSYSNGNWRILEWIIEAISGSTLPALLEARIFAPLGMQDTGWGSDTSLPLADGTTGYWQCGGWQEEITRICWSGDAALVTTLDDLLKWEAAMLQPDLRRLPMADRLDQALPHPDGSRGSYAFGINVWREGNRWMQWHGGALRGWRMSQFRFPQDQVAIVVMMNRTENPTPHALRIAREIGIQPTWDDNHAATPASPPKLGGVYRCAALGLVAEIATNSRGITLDLGGEALLLVWTGPTSLASTNGFFQLTVTAGGVHLHARHFGWHGEFVALPLRDDRLRLAAARFCHDGLGSTMRFSADGRSLTIEGAAGVSDAYPLRTLAAGVFAYHCNRALDEVPPGRFTLCLSDDLQHLDVSCLIARGLRYRRLG